LKSRIERREGMEAADSKANIGKYIYILEYNTTTKSVLCRRLKTHTAPLPFNERGAVVAGVPRVKGCRQPVPAGRPRLSLTAR
jgi:hypothetical protein